MADVTLAAHSPVELVVRHDYRLAPSRVVAASDSTTDLGVNRLPSATCLEAGEPAVQILRGSS
jgi:hypothetical protein